MKFKNSLRQLEEIYRQKVHSENEFLDYKIQFHFTEKKDKLELIKDIVSFANTNGGMIVYGVKDEDKSWVGLDDSSDNLNDIQIMDFLKKYVSGPVKFEIAAYELHGETYYLLTVDKNEGELIHFISDGEYKRKKKGSQEEQIKYVFKKNEEYGRIGSSNRSINDDATFKLRRKATGKLISNLSDFERPYKNYVDRPNEFKTLVDALSNDNVRNVQINGLGGIGKTSFIRNFCDRIEQQSDFNPINNLQFLIWITGKLDKFTTSGFIEQIRYEEIDYSDMITTISKVLNVDLFEKTDDELETEILEKLNNYNTLFVFDNMETIHDPKIIAFTKKVPINTRIIFTTRETLTTVYERIDLDGFDINQFTEYAENLVSDYRKRNSSCDIKKYYKDLHELVLGSPIITNMVIYKICNGFSPSSVLKSLRNLKKDKSYYDEVMKFCFDETINKMSILEKQILFVMSISDDKEETFQISDLKFILKADEMDINKAISHIFTVSFCLRKNDKYSCPSLVKSFANQKLSDDILINNKELVDNYYEWAQKKQEFSDNEKDVFNLARAVDFEKKEIVIYIRELLYKHSDLNNYDTIIDEFNRLIKKHPTYSYIYFKKACYLKTIGLKTAEVKNCFKQAIFNDNKNDFYLSEYAFYLAEIKDNGTAIDYFERALKINPDNPSTNHGLAVAYRKFYNGKPEYTSKSERLCELFSKGYFLEKDTSRYKNAHNARNAHAFALYLYTIGRNEEALKQIQKGFAQSPDNAPLKTLYSTIKKKMDPEYVSAAKINKLRNGIFSNCDDDTLREINNRYYENSD